MPLLSVYALIIRCPMCNQDSALLVPKAGFHAWQGGALIQNALPELSADQREQLISGTCPRCWDRMFAEPDQKTAAE